VIGGSGHEDRGVMGQFVVIEPGTEPPTRITGSHAHGATHAQ
jgi:hypothetical protein